MSRLREGLSIHVVHPSRSFPFHNEIHPPSACAVATAANRTTATNRRESMTRLPAPAILLRKYLSSSLFRRSSSRFRRPRAHDIEKNEVGHQRSCRPYPRHLSTPAMSIYFQQL